MNWGGGVESSPQRPGVRGLGTLGVFGFSSPSHGPEPLAHSQVGCHGVESGEPQGPHLKTRGLGRKASKSPYGSESKGGTGTSLVRFPRTGAGLGTQEEARTPGPRHVIGLVQDFSVPSTENLSHGGFEN